MASALPDVPGPSEALGDESYHARNPLLPVQPIHAQQRVQLPEAGKRNVYAERKGRKENSLALKSELDQLREDTEKKIKELSQKFSTKEIIIRNDIFNVSSFKNERKINSWNAKVAHKAKGLRERGEKGGLERARAKVMHDRSLRNGMPLPEETREAVMQHSLNQRSLKQNGARPTNKSAAIDASLTSVRIQTEMKRLNNRTGAAGLLITTRGHINDSIAPTIYKTNNASGFCRKNLGHALFDIGTRLESWAIVQSQNKKGPNFSTKELQKKCVTTIIEGLWELTGKDDAVMNYSNYESAIKSRYKVQLVGWPPHIPFANPSTISTEHLQRLSDALDSFECRWERMTRDEVSSHNTTLDTQLTAGAKASTVRKTRSDKGKKRTRDSDGKSSNKRHKNGGASEDGTHRVSRAAKQDIPVLSTSAPAAAVPAATVPVAPVPATPVHAFPALTIPVLTFPVPAISALNPTNV